VLLVTAEDWAPKRHDLANNCKANCGMKVRIVLTVSALTLLANCPDARADSFEDLWLTRIKPPPYGGVATEFDDTVAFDGKRLHPYRDLVCAHMLEQMGQRLRVTNVANGKSVVCTVADKGPNRRFWPRREIDLTPPASKAIGCDGMCQVSVERVAH
jgi:hypothetical protein